MRVNREEFLRVLTMAAAGLASREILEQSSCFVFKDGRIYTFNDEVAVSVESPVPIEGAVPSKKLLELLQKYAAEEVDVVMKDGMLTVAAGRKRSGVRVEAQISLPIDQIEQPGEWAALPAGFDDALNMVQQCCGKDASAFAFTCVHITSEFVEACDNYQIARYAVEVPVSEECLIRQDSAKALCAFGVVELSETPSWLHLRNADGLVCSCRRWLEKYDDLSGFLAMPNAHKVTLPGGLVESAALAEIFSADNAEGSLVRVDFKPGKARIRGAGVDGFHEELKNVDYTGEPMSFLISPKLLGALTEKGNQALIDEDRLKMRTGQCDYVACLLPPEE